ncbi:MAG TPA: DEAD/DEAH box helicase [Micromonosporaceae bacterium]
MPQRRRPAPQAPRPDDRSFLSLGVPAKLTEILAREGVTDPYPIQEATLPAAMAGRDVLGRGRTGSGKTYAFVLPVVTRLAAAPAPRVPKRPRALILAPTRELATQIDTVLAPLAQALSLRTMTVFGGVSAGRQISQLRSGVDIVVACPGRLQDHALHGHVDLGGIEITVIDEADHLADLGFLPVVRRLLDRTPRSGQRLLFSATLDANVDTIVQHYLNHPVTHSVEATIGVSAATSHHVLHGPQDDKFGILVELTAVRERSIVFTRTKRGAKTLTRRLVAAGVPAVELHGNLAQNARDRNLQAFTTGTVTTLVATDIAARGIDVADVRLVIHADPPAEHKAYVHRSGRTARAGNTGTVVSLTTDAQLPEVQRLAQKAGVRVITTRVHTGHPLLAKLAPGARLPNLVPATPAMEPAMESGHRPTSGGAITRGQRSTSASARAATAHTDRPGTSAAAFSARSQVGRRRGR